MSEQERDWRQVASAAQEEMIRHALALVQSANLIRAEMGRPPYQLRQARKPPGRPGDRT